MLTSDPRCAAESLAAAEPLAGSATTATSFLLLEERGPWGHDAWRDARLPEGLGATILQRAAAAGVRPLMIRRDRDGGLADHGGERRLFAASSTAGRAWLESTQINDPRELLDLDLSALGSGESLGLTPHSDAIYLVCTHGRRDRCCAELGRPLLQAVEAAAPGQAWGVSHLGGHRFAGNLLILPQGLMYGRVAPSQAPALVRAHGDGRILAEHLRGRTSWPPPVQAAEVALRVERNIDLESALELLDSDDRGDHWLVTFAVSGRVHRLEVAADRSQRLRQSCTDEAPSAVTAWTATLS